MSVLGQYVPYIPAGDYAMPTLAEAVSWSVAATVVSTLFLVLMYGLQRVTKPDGEGWTLTGWCVFGCLVGTVALCWSMYLAYLPADVIFQAVRTPTETVTSNTPMQEAYIFSMSVFFYALLTTVIGVVSRLVTRENSMGFRDSVVADITVPMAVWSVPIAVICIVFSWSCYGIYVVTASLF